ncbi:hypothetical protein ACHAW6_014804 [Cyclotella cf. meneghiniana]
MIGFSPLPYGDPNHRMLNNPLVASSNVTPLATTASQGLKRLASSREELERSWNSPPPGGLLHSVSCSRDSFDEDSAVERTFKRQRTIEIDSPVDSPMATPTPEYSSIVGGLRINPDNRPPRQDQTPRRHPVKAGWYHGQVDYVGNRHGRGHTAHDDGTEYHGSYVNDLMDGWGRYKFTTVKQLVSFPSRQAGAMHSATLHRVTERVFEGVFENDKPSGKGMMITTVIDSVPQCVATTGMEVKYVKVVYDVGFYKEDGRQVGEGARFTYTKSTSMTEWEEVCTRTLSGECSGLKVDRSYGNWVCDCLNMPSYPEVPSF